MNRMILMIGLFLFLFGSRGSAQETIVYKGDTVVTITPKQLAAVNSALVENEILKKEITFRDSLIASDSIRIENLGEVIRTVEAREKKKEDYYAEQTKVLVNENQKLKAAKKKFGLWSALSGTGGVILGLVIGMILL